MLERIELEKSLNLSPPPAKHTAICIKTIGFILKLKMPSVIIGFIQPPPMRIPQVLYDVWCLLHYSYRW